MNTQKVLRKIYSIKVQHTDDNSPDTSYLGEYSDAPSSEYSIDRQERGDMEHREYRYFNPSCNYVDKEGKVLPGNTAEEVRQYVEQDYERMESLARGYWQYIGIKAVATVGLSLDGGQTYKIDKLTSSGLWGIESDSDRGYLTEVENEQLQELKEYLLAYGFGRSIVARAIKV